MYETIKQQPKSVKGNSKTTNREIFIERDENMYDSAKVLTP